MAGKPGCGRHAIDLVGQRFDKLVVIARAPQKHGEQSRWHCLCDCGGTTIGLSWLLRHGKKRSCGCLIRRTYARMRKAERVKDKPEYFAWMQAKARCNSPTHQAYKDYGGRGITMSDAWQASFRQFLADMGARPTPKHTLDRIDNERGYEAGNCRWATFKTQHNNRRGNRHLEWRGERHTIAEWADITGISGCALYQRIAKGWSAERALTQPREVHARLPRQPRFALTTPVHR